MYAAGVPFVSLCFLVVGVVVVVADSSRSWPEWWIFVAVTALGALPLALSPTFITQTDVVWGLSRCGFV
jgi:hypothetical protein